MKLTILIKGREAIPIRAIPLITGWKTYSPDAVAAGMARKCDWDRLGNLTAFHISDGAISEILPKEWDRVVIAMKDVSESCKSRSDWETRSVATLPACFVWRNEFEMVYQSAMRRLTIVDERQGDKLLNWNPLVSDDLKSLILDGCEGKRVAEIRHRSDVIDNLDPKSRWNSRLFIEGFKSVQDPILSAKHFRAEVSGERYAELANERQLHVDHWIELVGVGIGQHHLYDITAECVKFREHEKEFISLCPPEWQADMMRDNRVAPRLDFPCTPIEIRDFVDGLDEFCDSAIGMHCFMLPDAFRRAVEIGAQSGAPESDAPSANTPVKKQSINGVDRNQILAAFPPPIGVTPEQWSGRLGDPSKAMKDARVFSGGKGVSALWNPAKFAMWYADENHMLRKDITTIMRRYFPGYLPEWEIYTASFN